MRRIILAIMFFSVSHNFWAQKEEKDTGQAITVEDSPEEKTPFKDKLYLGGNLGLTFGSYTNIVVAPMMGIRWSHRFMSEVGIEYNYTKDNRYESSYSYNQYGGRVNSQVFFLKMLFAQVEFAALSIEQYTQTGNERNFVPFLYLGGGLNQQVGNRSYISFKIMFDVLNNENSPYPPGSPVYTVGFGIGI